MRTAREASRRADRKAKIYNTARKRCGKHCKIMDKISTKQLLDTAIEIVGLANKCHRARLIDDWQASFSITDDTNYEFEVRVNPYRSSEKKWTAKARNYEHFETENNFTQDNMEEMKELKEHLEGLIEDARKDLQAKLDTLNG